MLDQFACIIYYNKLTKTAVNHLICQLHTSIILKNNASNAAKAVYCITLYISFTLGTIRPEDSRLLQIVATFKQNIESLVVWT